jgi:hypothetical protein
MTEGIYIAERNGQCQHCGHRFFCSEPNPAPICYHCKSAGRSVEVEAADPVETPATASVTYLGQPVNAPGFTQDSFTQAMARAFCDDLQITPYHDGRCIVHRAGLTGGYLVTRDRCGCKAGTAGTPCKHRAALIAHLDIREPHVRREWAQLNRERPARQAVAS